MENNFNFGWAALGLSIIFNLLPIFSFFNYFGKKQIFDNIPTLKIYSNYAKCLIWYFYGSLINNNIIRFSNMIGVIISLILIIIHTLSKIKKHFLNNILNFIIVIFWYLCIYEWFGHIILVKEIVGRVCLIVSIFSFFTQIPYIYNGIRGKNKLLLRINYSIISFPTHLCWIIFGLIIMNSNVVIANIIGIIFSITQIILYICLKKKTLNNK